MTHMLGVDSEVGRLRQVIVHRPGLELSRLTPQQHDELLFDDVLWAQQGQEEHDAFAEVLRDQGVACTTSAICSPRRSPCPKAGPSCSTASARRIGRPTLDGVPARDLRTTRRRTRWPSS